MPPSRRPFRDLVDHAIGGGWGDDLPSDGAVEVLVIRGTDLTAVEVGEIEQLPRRFEKSSKVPQRTLREGDLVLEISGGSRASGQATGRSALITPRMLERANGLPVIPASFCRLVRIKRDLVRPQYAHYLLQDMHSSGRAFRYQNESTGISNFQFETFLDAEAVAVPSLDDQDRIIAVVGALDRKVESNLLAARRLSDLARALFRAWFVDYEPVRARQEGCPCPGVPADAAALFPDDFEESDLGLLPAGWAVGTLSEVAVVVMGQSPPSSTYNNEGRGLPLIQGAADLGARFPAPSRYCEEPSRQAAAGAVLMTVRAPVGRVNRSLSSVCVGRGVAALESDCPAFVHGLLEAASWSSYEGGTVFPSVNKKQVQGFPVVVPPTEIRMRFQEAVGPLDALTEGLHREAQALAGVRASLLPRLLAGEIDVSRVTLAAA